RGIQERFQALAIKLRIVIIYRARRGLRRAPALGPANNSPQRTAERPRSWHCSRTLWTELVRPTTRESRHVCFLSRISTANGSSYLEYLRFGRGDFGTFRRGVWCGNRRPSPSYGRPRGQRVHRHLG